MFRWDAALRLAFMGAAVTWALVLPLTAFAATWIHAPSLLYAGAAAVDAIGSVLCHQLPEWSFHLWGVQLPVCARCLGIYVGGAVSALVAVLASERDGRPIEPGREARVACAIAAAPTVATLAYEWITGDMPANSIRAMAGVPIGAVVAWLVARRARVPVVSPEPADG